MIAARFFQSPVGVSARHVHLTQEHVSILFGSELHFDKELSQTGEFAASERLAIASARGMLAGVRVLGPVRQHTQIEVSRTDAVTLGVDVPVRLSGNLEGTPGMTLIGPRGTVILKQGTIVAARHLHVSQKDSGRLGLKNGDRLSARCTGSRSCIFEDVIVRVSKTGVLELHLDTDEANAGGLANGSIVDMLIAEKSPIDEAHRRFICVEDIETLIRSGGRFRLMPGQKITSSALELARSKNVLIQ